MIPLLLTYIFNIIDYLFTTYWIHQYGIDIEGNPIGRWLYQNNLAAPVKIFGVGAMLIILYMAISHQNKRSEKSFRWWDYASWIMTAIYAAIVIYHIVIAICIATHGLY